MALSKATSSLVKALQWYEHTFSDLHMYLFSLPYLTDTISYHVSGGFANLKISL